MTTSAHPHDDRLERVLAASPELFAYQRWLAAERTSAQGRDYLFLDERPRFEPRQEDVVVALPGLEVRARDGEPTKLARVEPAAEIELPGVTRADAERILAALDGERTLLEVRFLCECAPDALARVLRAAFGRVLFAPRAVAALEERLSACELVRFPSSPYAVERPYWENMIDVRAHFAASSDVLFDEGVVLRLIRELHVLTLMGATFERFYKPASPASDDAVLPGTLWHSAARLLRTARGTLFLSGPRVLAPPVGGAAFFARLCRALGDPEGAAPERNVSDGSLGWGGLVTARGERDSEPKPWFVPPRPIEEGHLAALGWGLIDAQAAADRADRAAAVAAAARFHWSFVRLHPFRCANQSLAMNLVNAVLARSHGAGVPHLALDHLALRLEAGAYQRAFARAVAAFVVPSDDPAERLGALCDRTRRALRFMDRSSAERDERSAEALAEADPEGARAALLVG